MMSSTINIIYKLNTHKRLYPTYNASQIIYITLKKPPKLQKLQMCRVKFSHIDHVNLNQLLLFSRINHNNLTFFLFKYAH